MAGDVVVRLRRCWLLLLTLLLSILFAAVKDVLIIKGDPSFFGRANAGP